MRERWIDAAIAFPLAAHDAADAARAAIPRAPDAADDPASSLLRIVLAFTAANALFNSLAVELGLGFPYTTFLADPADLFGDFFKVVLSYPGGHDVAIGNLFGLHHLLTGFVASGYDPRSPIGGADPGSITLLHLTPLSTLLDLIAMHAMGLLDPVLLFLALVAAMLGYAAILLRLAARGSSSTWPWLAAAMLSYPMLMVLTRGNLLAGATDFLILHAMLLALRGRAPLLAAVVLGLAINIRPNAAIFALPLIALSSFRLRSAGALLGATSTTFAASLALDGRLYPAYDMAGFLAGLQRYYALYVAEDDGLGYGSSLFGAAKMLLGRHPHLDLAAAAVGGIIGLVAVPLLGGRRIARSTCLFLICASYCLGSAVFADYHLLVFLIVPIAQSLDGDIVDLGAARAGPAPPELVAFLASCMMLVPKTYVFAGDDISDQVLLNPLLLLAAATAIIAGALGRTRGGPSPDRPRMLSS